MVFVIENMSCAVEIPSSYNSLVSLYVLSPQFSIAVERTVNKII